MGPSVVDVHRAWAKFDGMPITRVLGHQIQPFIELFKKILDETEGDLRVYLYGPTMNSSKKVQNLLWEEFGYKCGGTSNFFVQNKRNVCIRVRNVMNDSKDPGEPCGFIRGDNPDVLLVHDLPSMCDAFVFEFLVPMMQVGGRSFVLVDGHTPDPRIEVPHVIEEKKLNHWAIFGVVLAIAVVAGVCLWA